MPEEQPNNPLHGLTLETILNRLVAHYGWEALGRKIRIRCFTEDPSVKSSLVFLRRTQWARDKVERLYLRTRNPSWIGKASSSPRAPASPRRPASDPPRT